MKKRVTGIGGLFFKCKDVKAVQQWYEKHLGIKSDNYGAMFQWRDMDDKEKTAYTVWGTFKNDTKYFNPSEKDFMFNYRVENLAELLEELKKEGVTVVGEMEEHSYGKFGWIMDPEGNKIELWEPKDDAAEEDTKQ